MCDLMREYLKRLRLQICNQDLMIWISAGGEGGMMNGSQYQEENMKR